jgi:hypothetical protein
MLEELLTEIHNWFECDYLAGELTIVDGELTLPHGFVKQGQYYRIVGSVFNDGLHQYPASDFIDEVFDGEVWALAIPKAVIDIAAEIEAWCKANPDSVYTSESFGGYSYTKATAPDGTPMRWQDAFRRRLNRWRKLP